MAHRSKKKHLKHLHAHEQAKPAAKGPVAKANAARNGIAKKGAAAQRVEPEKPAKKRGIVSRLARKATKKITASRRRVISRVKSIIAG